LLKLNPSQCLIPAVLALTPVLGLAQTAPNAGTLLESVKPAPAVPAPTTGVLPEAAARPALQLDDHLKIAVKAVRISGNRCPPASRSGLN
jgi:hypothetical protein